MQSSGMQLSFNSHLVRCTVSTDRDAHSNIFGGCVLHALALISLKGQRNQNSCIYRVVNIKQQNVISRLPKKFITWFSRRILKQVFFVPKITKYLFYLFKPEGKGSLFFERNQYNQT